ncbi:MAG: hypothetical protein ACOZB3_01280 [Calditrichota bacterium]
MKQNRKTDQQPDVPNEPIVVHVGELMKQIARLADIRRKVNEGYYDRPEVLADIAEEIHHRLKQ